MKRSWLPAALMGTLALGYMAGSGGRGPRGEVAPADDPPAALAPAVTPPPITPVQPPPAEAPPASPIPRQLTNDRFGAYPAWNGVDLNCPDVGHPVRVIDGYDPHGLDRDGDGIGCDR